MTRSYVAHGTFTCVTWHIHMCDMTPSHVGHDFFIWGTNWIHICDIAHSYVHHDSFTRGPWLCWSVEEEQERDTCVDTHTHMHDCWHVGHGKRGQDFSYYYILLHICILLRITTQVFIYKWDSFIWLAYSVIHVTWLIQIWDMSHSYVAQDVTHSYVRHDSFTCAPWLIHICAMTQLHTYSCTYTMWAWHSRQARLICMCAMTHLHVCHDSYTGAPWPVHMCTMTHLRKYSCISYTYTAPYIDM